MNITRDCFRFLWLSPLDSRDRLLFRGVQGLYWVGPARTHIKLRDIARVILKGKWKRLVEVHEWMVDVVCIDARGYSRWDGRYRPVRSHITTHSPPGRNMDGTQWSMEVLLWVIFVLPRPVEETHGDKARLWFSQNTESVCEMATNHLIAALCVLYER